MRMVNIDRNTFIYLISFIILILVFSISIFFSSRDENKLFNNVLEGEIIFNDGNIVVIRDDNGNEYKVNYEINGLEGELIVLKYTGILDVNKELQNIEVIDYKTDNNSDSDINDNGLFSDFYEMAYDKLNNLTLDEKIGQLLLVRYPDSNQKELLEKYSFAGFVFFEKDFKYRTKEEINSMINELQNVSKIPLLTAVDEEGGKIVRISSNPALRDSPFLSSSELYNFGGFKRITEDTKEKSKLLKSLGINVNLAPVVDVSTDSGDYIYDRTLKEDTDIVSEYAKTVIEASKGTGVSYTLKHFPGYGNNIDTHLGTVIDNRSIEDIVNNDIPPFREGIAAGAEAILVSHNIVKSMDVANPASLSLNVHTYLRDKLDFTGVIMSDDLAMNAVSGIADVAVFAVKAGNNLIITTNYDETFDSIKNAVLDNEITEEEIDSLVFRTIAWKYYKGLMFNKLK